MFPLPQVDLNSVYVYTSNSYGIGWTIVVYHEFLVQTINHIEVEIYADDNEEGKVNDDI